MDVDYASADRCVNEQRTTWVGPHREVRDDGLPADREANARLQGSGRVASNARQSEIVQSLPEESVSFAPLGHGLSGGFFLSFVRSFFLSPRWIFVSFLSGRLAPSNLWRCDDHGEEMEVI